MQRINFLSKQNKKLGRKSSSLLLLTRKICIHFLYVYFTHFFLCIKVLMNDLCIAFICRIVQGVVIYNALIREYNKSEQKKRKIEKEMEN